MALKIPDFGGFRLPEEFDSNQFQVTNYGAPRRIELDEADEEKVSNIRNALLNSGLTIQGLFDLFNEWQSSKTRSVKRFALSLSFILAFSAIAGVDISTADLFGMSVMEGRVTWFLIFLMLILISVFGYYEYLRRNDLSVHYAKTKTVIEGLDQCLKSVHEIEHVVDKYKLPSIQHLFDDFSDQFETGGHDIEAYKAIKFYENNLKTPEQSRNIADKIELIVFYGLGLIALIAIIYSF